MPAKAGQELRGIYRYFFNAIYWNYWRVAMRQTRGQGEQHTREKKMHHALIRLGKNRSVTKIWAQPIYRSISLVAKTR